MELEYVTQFEITEYEGGTFDVKITDGLNYCILPEGSAAVYGGFMEVIHG